LSSGCHGGFGTFDESANAVRIGVGVLGFPLAQTLDRAPPQRRIFDNQQEAGGAQPRDPVAVGTGFFV